jgi:hypothetical protein
VSFQIFASVIKNQGQQLLVKAVRQQREAADVGVARGNFSLFESVASGIPVKVLTRIDQLLQVLG